MQNTSWINWLSQNKCKSKFDMFAVAFYLIQFLMSEFLWKIIQSILWIFGIKVVREIQAFSKLLILIILIKHYHAKLRNMTIIRKSLKLLAHLKICQNLKVFNVFTGIKKKKIEFQQFLFWIWISNFFLWKIFK